MKAFFLSLLFLFITACGNSSFVNYPPVKEDYLYSLPETDIHPVLSEILHQFLIDAKNHGIDIPAERLDALRKIQIVETLTPGEGISESTLGFCGYNNIGKISEWRNIEIRNPETTFFHQYTSYKLQANNFYLKKLMYHELGHCLLNNEHSEGKFDIMAKNISASTGTSNEEWEAEIEEFFSSDYQAAWGKK